MKVIIISDSHRNTGTLRGILLKEGRADAILHLGDGAADLYEMRDILGNAAVYQLQGNCDYYTSDLPVRLISDFGNIRFLACHGHSYNVKSGLSSLYFAAKEAECRLAFFGHTHTPYDATSEGVRLFNPGSAANGKYGVLTVNDGTYSLVSKTY